MPPDNSLGYADSNPSRPIRSIAASARLRRSALSTPSASRPSSTFCSTVSHGNSAKDWNTIETPFGGPAMVSPRHLASPADGVTRPAMMRNSVDLPDPERPSRPTISPERIVRSTFSRTRISSPLPLGNERQTPRISSRLVCLDVSSMGLSLSEAKAAFSEGIEWPPEQTVEQGDENTHHDDAEHDAREIAGFRRLRYIGAQPLGRQMGIAPAC